MISVLLTISVTCMIVFIYKVMGTNPIKYVLAPVVGALFAYLIYYFAMGLPVYIVLAILLFPVIAMIFVLARKNDNI